jgi:acetolactate synthase-1/2/3 large subunit
MKVDDVIANAFVKEGTTDVFGLLGDSQMKWWAAMSASGARMIDARDEGAALAMADGWARATGRTGVCSVTHGPGVSRLATSLITTARYRTPVVIHSGTTGLNSPNALQYLDQGPLVAATGAGYIEVHRPDYAENAVRQAFYRARVEARPIVLSVPIDVQTKDCEGKGDAYVPSSKMFAGQQRIRPDVEQLNAAADIIAAGRKPVILVGRGAMEPETQQIIDRLGKRIGALIAPTLHAKGVLGESDYYAGIAGLFATRTYIKLCEEADCVIAVGTSMNNYSVLVRGKSLYPNARVVHIDVAQHLMMGSGRGADCYVQGDAGETMRALDAMLAERNVAREGFRTPAVKKALLEAGRDPSEIEIEPGTVDPREAARILDEHLPSNVGLVVGDGHFMSFPTMLMKRPRAPHVFATAFGSIGQGLSTAIGVCAGTGGPMLCVEGDGGALQNIQELDTAARLGVKLLFVVMNDEAYGAEYHKLRVKKMNEKLSSVRAPDFAKIAEGFGCKGRLARTQEDIARAADEFMAGDGPMLLDVKMSRNVVSIPYQRMHFGVDI